MDGLGPINPFANLLPDAGALLADPGGQADREQDTISPAQLTQRSLALSECTKHHLSWKRVVMPAGSVVPPRRSGAASVVVKGKLYMFGGYGGGTGRLDDFYSFSFEENKWEVVEVLSQERPGCRENNGVVIGDGSRMYLFGGYNGSSWLNDLWRFDIDTKRL